MPVKGLFGILEPIANLGIGVGVANKILNGGETTDGLDDDILDKSSTLTLDSILMIETEMHKELRRSGTVSHVFDGYSHNSQEVIANFIVVIIWMITKESKTDPVTEGPSASMIENEVNVKGKGDDNGDKIEGESERRKGKRENKGKQNNKVTRRQHMLLECVNAILTVMFNTGTTFYPPVVFGPILKLINKLSTLELQEGGLTPKTTDIMRKILGNITTMFRDRSDTSRGLSDYVTLLTPLETTELNLFLPSIYIGVLLSARTQVELTHTALVIADAMAGQQIPTSESKGLQKALGESIAKSKAELKLGGTDGNMEEKSGEVEKEVSRKEASIKWKSILMQHVLMRAPQRAPGRLALVTMLAPLILDIGLWSFVPFLKVLLESPRQKDRCTTISLLSVLVSSSKNTVTKSLESPSGQSISYDEYYSSVIEAFVKRLFDVDSKVSETSFEALSIQLIGMKELPLGFVEEVVRCCLVSLGDTAVQRRRGAVLMLSSLVSRINHKVSGLIDNGCKFGANNRNENNGNLIIVDKGDNIIGREEINNTNSHINGNMFGAKFNFDNFKSTPKTLDNSFHLRNHKNTTPSSTTAVSLVDSRLDEGGDRSSDSLRIAEVGDEETKDKLMTYEDEKNTHLTCLHLVGARVYDSAATVVKMSVECLGKCVDEHLLGASEMWLRYIPSKAAEGDSTTLKEVVNRLILPTSKGSEKSEELLTMISPIQNHSQCYLTLQTLDILMKNAISNDLLQDPLVVMTDLACYAEELTKGNVDRVYGGVGSSGPEGSEKDMEVDISDEEMGARGDRHVSERVEHTLNDVPFSRSLKSIGGIFSCLLSVVGSILHSYSSQALNQNHQNQQGDAQSQSQPSQVISQTQTWSQQMPTLSQSKKSTKGEKTLLKRTIRSALLIFSRVWFGKSSSSTPHQFSHEKKELLHLSAELLSRVIQLGTIFEIEPIIESNLSTSLIQRNEDSMSKSSRLKPSPQGLFIREVADKLRKLDSPIVCIRPLLSILLSISFNDSEALTNESIFTLFVSYVEDAKRKLGQRCSRRGNRSVSADDSEDIKSIYMIGECVYAFHKLAERGGAALPETLFDSSLVDNLELFLISPNKELWNPAATSRFGLTNSRYNHNSSHTPPGTGAKIKSPFSRKGAMKGMSTPSLDNSNVRSVHFNDIENVKGDNEVDSPRLGVNSLVTPKYNQPEDNSLVMPNEEKHSGGVGVFDRTAIVAACVTTLGKVGMFVDEQYDRIFSIMAELLSPSQLSNLYPASSIPTVRANAILSLASLVMIDPPRFMSSGSILAQSMGDSIPFVRRQAFITLTSLLTKGYLKLNPSMWCAYVVHTVPNRSHQPSQTTDTETAALAKKCVSTLAEGTSKPHSYFLVTMAALNGEMNFTSVPGVSPLTTNDINRYRMGSQQARLSIYKFLVSLMTLSTAFKLGVDLISKILAPWTDAGIAVPRPTNTTTERVKPPLSLVNDSLMLFAEGVVKITGVEEEEASEAKTVSEVSSTIARNAVWRLYEQHISETVIPTLLNTHRRLRDTMSPIQGIALKAIKKVCNDLGTRLDTITKGHEYYKAMKECLEEAKTTETII